MKIKKEICEKQAGIRFICKNTEIVFRRLDEKRSGVGATGDIMKRKRVKVNPTAVTETDNIYEAPQAANSKFIIFATK